MKNGWWLWIGVAVVLLILSKMLPRYDMMLAGDGFVFRLDRRTGEICRYAPDGSGIAYQLRAALQRSN